MTSAFRHVPSRGLGSVCGSSSAHAPQRARSAAGHAGAESPGGDRRGAGSAGSRRRQVRARIASAAGDARGQASIELLGLLPLVAVIALVAMTVLASHAAGEQAGEAAEAGALALLQGGGESPHDAAEHALDEPTRKRARITISGRTVHVRVRPRLALPIPGLADELAGEAHADADQ
jgi:hypothetical protein